MLIAHCSWTNMDHLHHSLLQNLMLYFDIKNFFIIVLWLCSRPNQTRYLERKQQASAAVREKRTTSKHHQPLQQIVTAQLNKVHYIYRIRRKFTSELDYPFLALCHLPTWKLTLNFQKSRPQWWTFWILRPCTRSTSPQRSTSTKFLTTGWSSWCLPSRRSCQRFRWDLSQE